MKRIKVLVADDHKIVRLGLVALISLQKDFVCVGEAEDGRTAVEQALKLRPDVVVLDLRLPDTDGDAVTAEIRKALPDTKVVLLTSYAAPDGIARALANGATGALMKTAEDTQLVDAIRAVAAGRRFVSPDVRRLVESFPPLPDLSDRQVGILRSMTEGLTNRDIAMQLGVSEARVEQLVRELLAKVGAANRTEAVGIALHRQLLKI